MKTKFLLLVVLLLSVLSNAQIINCAEKEIEFNKSVLDNDFKKGYELWLQIKNNCSNFSEKNYILGSKVLNYNIQIASKENKVIATQELIKLYDLYDKNFPNNSNGNFEKRAIALHTNNAGSELEINNLLEKAFTKQQNSFSNPEALNLYFKYYYNKYKDGKSGISLDQLIEKFNEFTIVIEKNSFKYPENKPEYDLVLESATSLLSNVLSCNNLIPYIQKNFESNKNDTNWLTSTANAMSENCSKDSFFETVLLQLYKVKPNSKTASRLSDYYINSKEEMAIQYANDAVNLESIPIEKSKLAFKLATILVNSDAEKTNDAIKIAINNDPSNGRYLIFLANLYSNSISNCAFTEIEKKAIYKLASTTILKAGEVDPLYKKMASKLSDEYLKSANIDSSTLNKTVKIGCWINETVTF